MTIKHVFYDLDGTLLPMEVENFVRGYFEKFEARLLKNGLDKDVVKPAFGAGMEAMIKNNGKHTNEEAFRTALKAKLDEETFSKLEAAFDEFYIEDFGEIKNDCGYNEKASEFVKYVKSKGVKQYVTTNPLFPAVATNQRIQWTGLEPEIFEHITTYDNSSFCKPNPLYYQEMLDKFDLNPSEVLMVGNNTDEDMIAAKVGINVFLLTDNLLNESGQDIVQYPHGDFDDLREFFDEMM